MAEQVSRRSIIYDILVDFKDGKKSIQDAEKSLKSIDKTSGSIDNSMKRLGGAIAAAFATQQIVAFASEAVELARKAEGVKKAFERLNDATLLNDLRKATKGTVNDFELMAAAVRADKFKIPLKNLALYFQFARQRARETGESVDFLVKSIVEGIGKKSTQVLDNLGISAQQIQTEFKKTGDFGAAAAKVISDEFALAGEEIVTSADVFATFQTNVENFKLVVGEALLPLLNEFIGGINAMAEAFSTAPKPIEDTRSSFDKWRETLKDMGVEQLIKEIGIATTAIDNLNTATDPREIEALQPALKEWEERLRLATLQIDKLSAAAKEASTVTLEKLTAKVDELESQITKADITDIPLLTKLQNELDATLAKIESIKKEVQLLSAMT